MTNKVVVAGGGASGLTAAVFAAENGADVTIIEHKDRIGKKILMTGNGRCNLTNMNDVHGRYYSSDAYSLDRIYETLERFDAVKTREFFKRLGLYTKEKRDGGVYPVSEQASIVLDVLRSACIRLGVKIQTNCDVKAIRPDQTGGVVRVIQTVQMDKIQEKRSKTIKYDKLILATGGRAASVSGSDGSGYELVKKLGHHLIEPLPALVQLKCEGKFFKALSGVRAQGIVRLFVDECQAAEEEGEIQLTDYGISGIPVFQLSRLASRALYDGKKCEARINFLSYMEKSIMEKSISNALDFSYKTVEEFLSGMVHKKIAAVVCKQNGIVSDMTVGQAGFDKVYDCINMLADFRIRITAPNSFDNAQVCCGGVPLREVDKNFQSCKCKDIFIIGELLDCDGICGGYNLQWAWATGAIAGANAALQV